MRDDATSFDTLIVGAGPGGIAAAVTLAEAGRRVGLVDEAPFAGGQIWRGGSPGNRLARHWLDRLAAVAGSVTWFRQSRVVARPSPRTLLVDTPDGPRYVAWRSLVLAVGARELFLPFPGWTLPGVVGAGGLQALVKQGLPVAGKRIVVAGTGPLLLAVADLAKSQGAIVPLILEQTPAGKLGRFAASLLRTPSKLVAAAALRARLLGTSYASDAYPVAATREGARLRVEYRQGTRTESVDCDYLACGFNLIPNNELPQLLGCALTQDGFVRVDRRLRTTVPDVYAIGEVTGIGGVEKALIEGRIVAHAIAGDEAAAAALAREHAAQLDFARRLREAFSLRPEVTRLARPETILCRCEDVPVSAVRQSFSGRDAKLQTRCGMGACQGRVCGPAMQQLFGSEPPQVRPPIFATSVGTLAAGFHSPTE